MNEVIEFAAPPEESLRATLNHKLRTPLNAIIGFAELLSLRAGVDRVDPDVQQILNSAREMLRIIEIELAERPPAEITPIREDEPASAKKCDVLYVEDDAVNFTLVERILEYRSTLKLMHAERGYIGLEMAAAYKPKLILLDLNLPDMHGSEVLKRMQENPETAGIPLVVLSANATPTSIERLLSAGARNYITKPFNIDHFLAVVDEFVTAA